ncbi:pimeloyl-ACP methyl ester carboxylesterase [Catenulispora sp. GAS73]|uniref:epoxide hydrolase family protein n=1 Tax=Catenulispora sp. GAS73 TaxID=3156269 RepID=UPI0035117374
MTAQQNTAIRPYRVEIPQAAIDDLNDRLDRARWTDVIDGTDGEYGTALSRVRRLAEYWRNGFDWRAYEARLNAYPQFLTEIDGQDIHFLHVKSQTPNGTALILTHGWPGSQAEYLNVVEPLTAAGFDLVIPAVPGFGFAGPTTARSWNLHRTARAWAELMARLGYRRYGAVGNDAGSMLSPEIGRLDPEHVIGVHVTQLFSFPSGDPAEMADLTEEEQQALQTLSWFWENMGAFNQLQSQQPQTLAHALADSPIGLLGWNIQLLPENLDDDFVIANVATYWYTGTAGSAIRFYREMVLDQEKADGPTTAPTALAGSANDFFGIRRFAERDHANIVRWNVYQTPGHYTAHQNPEVLVDDVVEFFASLG